MQKIIMEWSEKIAQQRHMAAIRRGLLFNMPLMVFGSLAIMISNLPLSCFQQLMSGWFGSHWKMVGQAIHNGSFQVLGVLLVFSISVCLAESHALVRTGVIHPVIVGLVSFSCLMAIMQPLGYINQVGMAFRWTGTSGVFLAMPIGLVSAELFLALCSIPKISIRIFCDEADPVVSQAMASIVPAALTITVFALIKTVAGTIGVYDIHEYVYRVLVGSFVDIESSLGSALIYVVMIHFFWFFGIHGNNVLEPVAQSLYDFAAKMNMSAIAAGEQATAIFTKNFFDAFVLLGGAGSTLCLILAILMVSKRGNMNRLAKISLLPGVFNINELLVFGLPIVMNPIYLVPFLLVPVVLMLLSFAAMATGLVPITVNLICWTTPPLLSGYMATGSWGGVLLQVISIILGVAIYFPFVKLAEQQKSLEMQQAYHNLLRQGEASKPQIQNQLTNRRDSVGNLARVLAHDLKEDLANQKLLLEYQPQVDNYNRVIGVEALLRWSHKRFGRIPPPTIIAIAEETGIIQDLGKWTISEACRQLGEWQKAGIEEIRMSVNVSVMQLYYGRLEEHVAHAIKANSLLPKDIEIEITESIALSNNASISKTLNLLHDMGVRVAIDDFGMGHSSLLYIKNFPVDTLKIDRSLSQDVIKDKYCRGIIQSIVSLCTSLNIETIVEYVEGQEQRELLEQLGCTQYQGFLYSPALSADDALHFIRRMNQGGLKQEKLFE